MGFDKNKHGILEKRLLISLKSSLFTIFYIKNLDKSEFYTNFVPLLKEDHINNHLRKV